jgi:hypothetical protein
MRRVLTARRGGAGQGLSAVVSVRAITGIVSTPRDVTTSMIRPIPPASGDAFRGQVAPPETVRPRRMGLGRFIPCVERVTN